MKLVVHELLTSLEQKLIPTKIVQVTAVRPHLYRHNFATGSLKVRIKDADSNVIGESQPLSISSIETAPYFHGYVTFMISAMLQKDVEYTFELVGEDGYTFNESAYIGWCNSYDLNKYPMSFIPASDFTYPMDVEIWNRRKV